MKVDAVLTVANGMNPSFPSDFEYKVVQIYDGPESNLKDYLFECIEFMQKIIKSGKSIYVHCEHGSSRSPSVVIAYLMASKNISLDDAFEFISTKRPCILPNDGFIEELKVFEQELKNQKVKKSDEL